MSEEKKDEREPEYVEDLRGVKYPELDRIMTLKPNPHILLGKDIVFTEKRDGSNIGLYLTFDKDDLPVVGIRSRNMNNAAEEFHRIFKDTGLYQNVLDLLIDAATWRDDYVLFGELLIKGKSPTRIELHEKNEFVAFDLWSKKVGGFVNYTKLYQECYHFDIPVVELWGSCNCKNLNTLLGFKDALLVKAKETGREGVVGKYVNNDEFIYFKEKNDTPKYEKVPRVSEEGMIVLPPLPESELMGAVEKVYADLGKDFFDIRKAMPKIAEYVAVECKKHNCSNPEKKLIAAYKERMEVYTEG
jgi:hypothetical protein